jgi:hypothetical protein
MVSPGEWGPNMWELLHGIAERVGNQTKPLLIRDEQTELRMTLRQLAALMPCAKCQGHYRQHIQTSFPNTSLYGEFLKDALREWLYKLHEDVNTRREIVSNVGLADLKEKYKSVDLRGCATRLKSIYSRGVQSGVLKPEDWKIAWKHLDFLLRFIGT